MTAPTTVADTVASSLFSALTAGTVSVPAVNLTSAEFALPEAEGNPFYQNLSPITEAMLTTGKVGGTGMFDTLMSSIGSHLEREHKQGRITGKEYSEAWVNAMAAALSTATQFVLSKDQSHYQAQLAQLQVRMAETQTVTERLNAEITKAKLVQSQTEALTAAAALALTKLQLARENAQYDQTVAQTEGVTYQNTNLLPAQLIQLQKQNDKAAYELANLLPQELAKALKQVEAATAEIAATAAQTSRLTYETANILPAQKAQIEYQTGSVMAAQVANTEADTATKSYSLINLMPKEVLKAEKQIEAATAEIAVTTAKKDQIVYETGNILPAQKAQLTAETSKVTYEVANLLPKELDKATAAIAGLTADTATKNYNLTYLLPKELEKSIKQLEAVTAEISVTTAKKDQVLYETAEILPTQKAGLLQDNAIKVYTLSTQLPATVAGITADNAAKAYSNQFLLPAQLESIREQTEGHRSKTLDTRSDGTPIGGAVKVSMDLQVQQIESYKRDAEAKVGKMLLDTWITQKSLDEGLPAPTSLTDAQINSAMTKIRQNLNMV